VRVPAIATRCDGVVVRHELLRRQTSQHERGAVAEATSGWRLAHIVILREALLSCSLESICLFILLSSPAQPTLYHSLDA
jgi:hypothetical protein